MSRPAARIFFDSLVWMASRYCPGSQFRYLRARHVRCPFVAARGLDPPRPAVPHPASPAFSPRPRDSILTARAASG